MHGGAEAVKPIGCGIAGFTDGETAPLFAEALSEDNICLLESCVSISENGNQT